MKPLTVTCGPLRFDWDTRGTLTIARTDTAQSVQLSKSEWIFFVKCAELAGWPIAAPVQPPAQPSS